jgi:hypothetical protein
MTPLNAEAMTAPIADMTPLLLGGGLFWGGGLLDGTEAEKTWAIAFAISLLTLTFDMTAVACSGVFGATGVPGSWNDTDAIPRLTLGLGVFLPTGLPVGSGGDSAEALNNVTVTFLVADSVRSGLIVKFCTPIYSGGGMVEVAQNWGDVVMTVTISVTVGLSSSGASSDGSTKAQKVGHADDWLTLGCLKMSVSLSPKPITFPQSIENELWAIRWLTSPGSNPPSSLRSKFGGCVMVAPGSPTMVELF